MTNYLEAFFGIAACIAVLLVVYKIVIADPEKERMEAERRKANIDWVDSIIEYILENEEA